MNFKDIENALDELVGELQTPLSERSKLEQFKTYGGAVIALAEALESAQDDLKKAKSFIILRSCQIDALSIRLGEYRIILAKLRQEINDELENDRRQDAHPGAEPAPTEATEATGKGKKRTKK